MKVRTNRVGNFTKAEIYPLVARTSVLLVGTMDKWVDEIRLREEKWKVVAGNIGDICLMRILV